MMGLCAAEGIGVIPWSPLARGRLARPWDERAGTERAGTDEFGKTLYARTEEADRAVVERVGEVAAARRAPGAGRAGLAARQARGHVADHRRDQAPPPGGRGGRPVDQADPRGDGATRGTLRPAPRPRLLVIRSNRRPAQNWASGFATATHNRAAIQAPPNPRPSCSRHPRPRRHRLAHASRTHAARIPIPTCWAAAGRDRATHRGSRRAFAGRSGGG